MAKRAAANPLGRVLVIDDDEIALEAIRELLVGAGYHVQCLSSPIGATQVIVSQGIEAVVVDLNMPVMRGDRFISLVRSWDRIRDLPTVLISGTSSEALESVAAGMSGVQTVTKDSMHRTLTQALERLLAKERSPTSRRPGDLTPEERQSLSQAAQVAVRALSAVAQGTMSAYDALTQGVRALRDQAQALGLNNVVRLLNPALELATTCAERREFTPDARVALRGALDLLATPDAPLSTQASAVLAMHLSRIQRVREDFAK